MSTKNTYKKIRLILGDQLNENHSWLKEVDDGVLYVLMELKQEQEYVKHHIQKTAAFFKAMRSFEERLKALNHQTHYITITDQEATNSFNKNLISLAKKYKASVIEYQYPDEYRLAEQLKELENTDFNINAVDSEHFYTTKYQLKDFFKDRKTFILESFYQMLRKKHNILVDDQLKPEGGKWNYDKENRNKIPKNHNISELKIIKNDVSEVLSDIKKAELTTFGNITDNSIDWPINRKQSLDILTDFLENGLVFFGQFQDAMTLKSWRVYHSLLSFSLNVKLISPKEVVDQSLAHYRKNSEDISLAQIEGFVRQILGWREYVRGIYWLKMPNYSKENFLELERELPSYYWDGKTKMTCVGHSARQSLDKSYAHHIQRLMILGNFALLNGTNPDEVDKWYLGVYADAIEWVQLPNTRGMSQFADGGIVGTKPYVSSANYINKMGDYCSNCSYDKKLNHGENACPFNSLYWNFIDQHESKLKSNRRMSMMYAVWNKKSSEERTKTLEQAEKYLDNINEL